jgi:glycosyltransferase involved in cell wall biosynthesis
VILVIAITFLFIILRFTVTLFNFISNPKLHRVARQYTDKVSILIPARDEGSNILTLLNAIQQQDYPNYEVIILDDASSDNTYQRCADFAAKDSRFKVIRGKELPTYWLGKNYACYQLAREASGEFLLFLDADEKVQNGLINSAIHRMYLRKLSLLSLFANQEMQTIGELSVVPLMHYLLLNLLPLQLVYLVKNQSEIMKLVKAARLNGEALLGNAMVSCRMYNSYKEAVGGFSKNFLAAFNYSIIGLLMYIVVIIGGPMIVMITLDFHLIFFMAGLIILTRFMISLSAGQNPWFNIILHPIQMFNLVLIGFLAIQKYLTKTIVWKGRNI